MTERKSVRPNFFVVGAPKCGTTSLWKALLGHPEVFVPQKVKEPHFFGSDLDAPYFIRDEAAYLGLFELGAGYPRVGEASPWYLYSRRAASEIQRYAPDARIIALLRNPVDMMYSLHSQRLYNGGEDIVDFARALEAEPARSRGERLPRVTVGPPEGLLYRAVARYSEQLERFLAAFGREAVEVVIFEDLRKDPEDVYRGILRFLEVDPELGSGFPKSNTNKTVRSARLRDWLRSASRSSSFEPLRRLAPKPVRSHVARTLTRFNTRVEARQPMPAELRAALIEEMRPEVERVSQILGRDLSADWGR